jgi:dolichol-phosphate mannosyltransferase
MQMLQRDFEILICLDGGCDESLEVIANFQKFHPITVLPLQNQRGLGLAYKRLFEEVIKNSADDDLIISLDADNTHNPEQITDMISRFESQKLDLIIASRFCDTSVMADFPLHRQLVSKSISILFQNLFRIKKINGEKLQDFTSGYRIYSAKKLKELFAIKKNKFINEPEFTYTCELVVNFARIGARIDEIAISYDYGNKIGKSKLRLFRNFVRLIILLIKLLPK